MFVFEQRREEGRELEKGRDPPIPTAGRGTGWGNGLWRRRWERDSGPGREGWPGVGLVPRVGAAPGNGSTDQGELSAWRRSGTQGWGHHRARRDNSGVGAAPRDGSVTRGWKSQGHRAGTARAEHSPIPSLRLPGQRRPSQPHVRRRPPPHAQAVGSKPPCLGLPRAPGPGRFLERACLGQAVPEGRHGAGSSPCFLEGAAAAAARVTLAARG